MKKILLASKNKNKLIEFREILSKYDYKVISLEDLNDNDEVEETGLTFRDNAIIKAQYYYDKYHLDTIADDSGISIRFFNDGPGIYSARFMSEYDYKEKNDLILKMMEKAKDRYAYYTCDIAVIINGEVNVFEGILEGEIALAAKGVGGFGYDPIFYLPSYQKTTAQIDKSKISHRAKALEKMVAYFEK